MSSIKWKEEPNLKCEISLNNESMGQTLFTIIDDNGNEFELGTPEFSFNVTVCSGADISQQGNHILRVGKTALIWQGNEITRIGNVDITWLSNKIRRIGRCIINWQGNEINSIGQTSISWLSGRVCRVGRASVYSDGSISGTVK